MDIEKGGELTQVRPGTRHRQVTETIGSHILLLSLIVLASLALRCVTAGTAFSGEQVTLYGPDSYYHARRTSLILDGDRTAFTRDPMLNYPHGAAVPWPPGFDLFLAGACKVLSPFMDRDAAMSAIMPVLGAAAVLVLYFLALALFKDHRAALLAAGLLAALPAHAGMTLLARVDHHALPGLLVPLYLLLLLKASTSRTRVAGFALAAGAGLCSFALFFSLPATPWLYLAPSLAASIGLWAGDTGKGPVPRLDHMATANGIAAVLLLLWLLSVPPQRPCGASLLSYRALLLCLGIAGSGLWAYFLLQRPGGTAGTARVAAAAAGALLLHTPAAWCMLSATSGSDLSMLLATDPLMAGISESRPLLADLGLALEQYSLLLLLLPGAIYSLGSRAAGRRGGMGSGEAIILLHLCAFLALALLQQRFAEALAPFMALALSWYLVTVVWPRLGAPRPWASAALLAAALLPCIFLYRQGLQGGSGPFKALSEVCGRNGPVMSISRPRKAVLAPWSMGNAVIYRCGLPTVANPFATPDVREGIERAARLVLTLKDEHLLNPSLPRLWFVKPLGGTAGYYASLVGLDPKTFLSRGRGERAVNMTSAYYSTIWARLAHFDGSRSRFEGRVYDGLGRFRFLDESGPPLGPWPGQGKLLKVFELVEGFTLQGEASPGSRVLLKARIMTPRGRKFGYLRATRAGPDGMWSLKVPYPNQDDGMGAYCLGPYKVLADRKWMDLTVRKRQGSNAPGID